MRSFPRRGTERHVERVMGHFRDALRRNGVSEAAALEFLTVLRALGPEVVP
jgi:truncated hemoglobin YjbI